MLIHSKSFENDTCLWTYEKICYWQYNKIYIFSLAEKKLQKI